MELIIHLVACAFMTGLIWVIQVLHYPAFSAIAENDFQKFHLKHTSSITWIVAPVMLIELLTALLLLQLNQNLFFLVNTILLLGIWISTGLLSVPIHAAIGPKKDLEKINQLVRTNWPRTILWSLRLLGLMIYMIGEL